MKPVRAFIIPVFLLLSVGTASAGMTVVPVLFVISFLVPGVLLQWEGLRETVWIDVR
jgi:hypothetical protein